jgi:hypothetical protein
MLDSDKLEPDEPEEQTPEQLLAAFRNAFAGQIRRGIKEG